MVLVPLSNHDHTTTHHSPSMSEPSKQAAHRALNQLMSLVVGRRFASQTDNLKTDPEARLNALRALVAAEVAEGAQLMAQGSPDGKKRLDQGQRKLDSLDSLDQLEACVSELYGG